MRGPHTLTPSGRAKAPKGMFCTGKCESAPYSTQEVIAAMAAKEVAGASVDILALLAGDSLAI